MTTNANPTLQQVLTATQTFSKEMTASPTIREAYRTDDCLLYRVYPAGSTKDFTAIEVRLDMAFGDARLTLSHSSNNFSTTVEALAHAQAVVAAAHLMAQLKAMLQTVAAAQ